MDSGTAYPPDRRLDPRPKGPGAEVNTASPSPSVIVFPGDRSGGRDRAHLREIRHSFGIHHSPFFVSSARGRWTSSVKKRTLTISVPEGQPRGERIGGHARMVGRSSVPFRPTVGQLRGWVFLPGFEASPPVRSLRRWRLAVGYTNGSNDSTNIPNVFQPTPRVGVNASEIGWERDNGPTLADDLNTSLNEGS